MVLYGCKRLVNIKSITTYLPSDETAVNIDVFMSCVVYVVS
jgi:hypothetical protein